jgi:hypothetical protein
MTEKSKLLDVGEAVTNLNHIINGMEVRRKATMEDELNLRRLLQFLDKEGAMAYKASIDLNLDGATKISFSLEGMRDALSMGKVQSLVAVMLADRIAKNMDEIHKLAGKITATP